MEQVVQLIQAIAWPLAVIIIVLTLRQEIRRLLGRLSRVKYKDAEAVFEGELRQAEDEAAQLRTARAMPEAVGSVEANGDDEERLLQIAQVSPRAAIAEAWRGIESAALATAQALGEATNQRGGIRSLVRALAQQAVVPEQTAELLDRLRRLRNEAAHAPDFAVDKEDAERYIKLAALVTSALTAASARSPESQ